MENENENERKPKGRERQRRNERRKFRFDICKINKNYVQCEHFMSTWQTVTIECTTVKTAGSHRTISLYLEHFIDSR